MFKTIDVWKRISDSEAVRYRCFQCLRTGKYSVQSADFYRLPGSPDQSAQLRRQHIERSSAYSSLLDRNTSCAEFFRNLLVRQVSGNRVLYKGMSRKKSP